MRHFWQGFAEKTSAQVSFKRHVIVLYWEPGNEKMRDDVRKMHAKFPSVKVKIVNATKDPTKLERHKILKLPTVLLLKNGREVDRLGAGEGTTMLEQIFRRAGT